MSDIVVRIDRRAFQGLLRSALAVGLVLYCAAELGSEAVTLTTYYPAPSGIYTQFVTTDKTVLGRDGGSVGVGVANPAAKLEVAQNQALKVGRAYLSSGGDFAHLANNEWYNGSSWQASAPGALLQLTGQNLNVYAHNGAGAHDAILQASPARVTFHKPLAIVDGSEGAGKVLTSDGAGNASWRAASSGSVPSCNNANFPEASTNRPCAARMYRCPWQFTAQGVGSGPWASYGCVGQLQPTGYCMVYVYPYGEQVACSPVGRYTIQ